MIKRVPLIRMCGSPTVVRPVKCRDCSSMYKIIPPFGLETAVGYEYIVSAVGKLVASGKWILY